MEYFPGQPKVALHVGPGYEPPILRFTSRTPEVREYRLGDAFYIKLVLSLVGGPVGSEQVLLIQRRELYQQLHEATDGSIGAPSLAQGIGAAVDV